ncbi:MAG: hypothetical protein ABW252_06655 [Polyangiales bacterium]
MTRDTLHTILRSVTGLQEKAGTFRAQSEQKLTLYLGGDGRGLVVSQIEELKLEDGHVSVKTKEPGAFFADYAAIFAVSAQPPKEGSAPKKAGFA